MRGRIERIQRVAEHFSQLSEAEADLILGTAGSEARTPSYWNGWPDSERRDWAASTFASASAEVFANIADVFDEDAVPPPVETPSKAAADGPIFVVHGHAHGTLHEAVRVLERATGRDVIVLHEQANAGRTILEKFEDHAAAAVYAVVLLTADDEGGVASGSERRPRGRQNVVFELGFFFGKLGRNRVAVLLDHGVEKPSDIDGLVYITIDPAGAWKQALARELVSARIAVDYSRIP